MLIRQTPFCMPIWPSHVGNNVYFFAATNKLNSYVGNNANISQQQLF